MQRKDMKVGETYAYRTSKYGRCREAYLLSTEDHIATWDEEAGIRYFRPITAKDLVHRWRNRVPHVLVATRLDESVPWNIVGVPSRELVGIWADYQKEQQRVQEQRKRQDTHAQALRDWFQPTGEKLADALITAGHRPTRETTQLREGIQTSVLISPHTLATLLGIEWPESPPEFGYDD